MKNFGFSLIVDPGGPKLLREADAHNVEDLSRIVVEPGTAALMIVNGQIWICDEPGRYPVKTGLSPWFKSIQNVVSKGQATRTSRFLFFDTNPAVYRDIVFMVPNLICQEASTKLQVESSPYINVSVRIKNYETFFFHLKAYDFDNSAISTFLADRVVPWIRKEIYTMTLNKPILDLNANACNFSKGLYDRIKSFLETFGLDVKNAQILDLNLSADSKKEMSEFQKKNASVTQDVEIIQQYADQLFQGDMNKAIQFILMKSISEGGRGSFDPLTWELTKQFMNNNKFFS